MGDPSLLVTRPTAGDPSLAPPGRDLLYILAPAPNTEVGHDRLGRHLVGIRRRDARRGHRASTPTRRRPRATAGGDTRRLGSAGHGCGNPVRAGAHVQPRPDRSGLPTPSRGVDNVVLAGSSTVPGSGRTHRGHVRAAGRRPDHRSIGTPSGTRGVPTMIGSELDAAGVRDPSLRAAFRQCREINARHGKTFFLATRLLAPRTAPCGARALRVRPARRRHPRRLRYPRHASSGPSSFMRCPRSCSIA